MIKTMSDDIEARYQAIVRATMSYVGVLRRDAHLIHGELLQRYSRDPFLGTELEFIPQAYREDRAATDFIRLHGCDEITGWETASLLATEVGVLQHAEDPQGKWFRVSREVPERMLTHELTISCTNSGTFKNILIFGPASYDPHKFIATYTFPPGRENNAWQTYYAAEIMPGVSVSMETR